MSRPRLRLKQMLAIGPRPWQVLVLSVITGVLTGAAVALFDWLVEHDVDIALDTGWPITGWTAEVIAKTLSWLPCCRHLLLNEGEILALTGNTDALG